LEGWECGDAEFMSSRLLQSEPGAHGGDCLLQSNIKEKPLGRCQTGNRECSPNQKSCLGDWLNLEEDCLVKDTIFGSCDDRCSWSPDDCVSGEKWTFPSTGCSCDKVQVGACEKDGMKYCAVSYAGCDIETKWLSPLEAVDCFLCREVLYPPTSPTGTTPSTPSSPAMPSSPVQAPAGQPSGAMQDVNNKSYARTNGIDLSVTVGATVGLLVGLAISGMIVVYLVGSFNKKQKENVLPGFR